MSVTQATLLAAETKEEKPIEGCKLGRALGDCPLKRKAGCGSLYDAMMHVLPPYSIRLLVRDQLQHDKAAQDWLRRLDDVLPEQRPSFDQRRRW